MQKHLLIQTLGCKVSQYEAGKLEKELFSRGFSRSSTHPPDLFVLHSCSVTGRASQKTRQILNSARRKWPEVKVLLAGCEGKFRELKNREATDADGVLLPDWKPEDLGLILDELGFGREQTPPQTCGSTDLRTRAFLKIQDGCEHFCTYCIVPHLRGPERSKPIETCFEEAQELVETGFREIVLTGIHLGRYEFGLINLLNRFERINNLSRVRLSSIEPLEIDEPVIDWLSTSPKACRHLHLPLQSGSNSVLKRMNRPYSSERFSNLVLNIRERLPKIALTTDVMVGFPAETEEEFEESFEFIKKIRFSRLHIFRYSPRDGTPAAIFPNQIPADEKKRRAKKLDNLGKDLLSEYHRFFIGKTIEVLWERSSNGFWSGFSREYLPCRTQSTATLENTITEARVIEASSDGVLVETSNHQDL